MKKTRNISSLHLEHKRFAFHLYAPSSKVCESLHFFASCMLGEAVCKYVTLLVTQWLRETCCYGNGHYNRPSPYFSCFPWTIKTANCDEFGGRPLYRDSLGKLWRYKCLIHISRHRVSCLSFRWESCKFLYLLAVVTIDWTDWSQNPLRLINPLSVFFIFLLRNSKYHSRFSSYDLVFGYEHCQPWPLYFCMAISLSLLSQMAPSWSLVLASCLQERYPREASLDGSIRREWSFIA